jgi:small subunit ribosomal protein S1
VAEQEIEGWLTEPCDYKRPQRGQIRHGVILRVEKRGIIVDVGLKRDGFVPIGDVERLGKGALSELAPGQEIETCVVRPEDREGKLVLSLYKARLVQDWARAKEMMENEEICHGVVNGCNRGGLTVNIGRLHGFIPASHLWRVNSQRLEPEERREKFQRYVGQELPLKVIEVKRIRRRLILSERLARQQLREQHRERLLNELLEGQVCRGTVSHLREFGAFVDLGGADGLIHISELSWRRVQHPSEVVQMGDEVEVYVLRLDHERKRIGLSLKRLQPDPWSLVDMNYVEGQLVSGVVTNVAKFGAFVALDMGIEGLIHFSELTDPPPKDPRTVVQVGDELVLRILRIESYRRRIGLSLKRVSSQERDDWLMSRTKLAQVLQALRGAPLQLSSDFKKRQARIQEKLGTGRPVLIAEAVRDLTYRSRHQKLTQKDEQLLNRGRELLEIEMTVATDLQTFDAKETINAALEVALEKVPGESDYEKAAIPAS